MSLKKTISHAAVAVGIAASTLVTFGAGANAQHWQGRGSGNGAYNAPAPRRGAPMPYHAPPPMHHDRHRGDNVAKGVAIGLGALILGSILSSEASRRQHYDGY